MAPSAESADGGGRARFLADAAARGLDVEIVERLAASSLEEAAGILGTPTLMIRSGDADPYVIQLTNVDDLRAALDDALDT